MKKISSILFVISFFALNVIADINKSPSDPRKYSTFTLKNGIEVVTVSDPKLTTSAVTLSVGVGQFQDPENAQGIAHFLEHMIFMGSEKYKSPNEYMQFISENGGSTNAFTAAEQTTYLFSINSRMFSQGLDRLSSAIKSPLFDASMVEKEISAVNSEWLLLRQSDQFVVNRASVNTTNPNHPKSQLGVGNNETLSRDKEILLSSLREFYNQYYSANLMKLVLVGNQSQRELKSYAKKYFGNIKNNKIERPVTKESGYLKDSLLKNIYVQTKTGQPSLTLEFPFKDNRDKWKSKPNQYVSRLLNSQEENSLFSYLTDEGYIEGGVASINPNVWGADGAVFFDFTLTSKGLANKDLVIDLTFKYIDLISTQGINKKYYDEMKAINDREFEDYTPPQALSMAVNFGSQIFDVPIENLIDYNLRTDFFDEKAIQDVLSQLVPSNVRIYHLSPDESTSIDLKYADGSYRVETIPQDDLTNWGNTDIAIYLPEPEVISFDDKDDITFASKEFETPQIVFSEKGVQAFLSQSKDHKNNKGIMQVKFMSPTSGKSAQVEAELSIILYHFFKKNRGKLAKAYRGAGISIIPQPDQYGNLGFTFIGRSLSQIKYANQLMESFASFEIKDWEVQNAIKIILDSLEDSEEDDISNQLFTYDSELDKTSRWNRTQVISAMKNVTRQSILKTHKDYMSTTFLDIYAYGNYNPAKVKIFAKDLRDIIGPSTQLTHFRYIPSFKPMPGTASMKKVSIPKDGVGILDNYIYPEKSKKITAQLSLINKLFRPTFFNELRSNQEVGYIASSFSSETNEYPTLSTVIVSDSNNLEDLKVKVMSFNYGFAVAFKDLDNKTIENVKKAMIEELEKEAENLFVESSSYLDDWGKGNYNFDTDQLMINHIKNTSKDDLVALVNQMFVEGQYMNTTVQIRGEDFKDTPFFNW
tara:strand:+ start:1641 stop:4424 length:2784 start_codon:yes stop_codon:yes gene_type:complete